MAAAVWDTNDPATLWPRREEIASAPEENRPVGVLTSSVIPHCTDDPLWGYTWPLMEVLIRASGVATVDGELVDELEV